MRPELDELLEDGVYRLRIDGRTYAPIDKQTLVMFLQHVVLMGDEEIAVLDGPWMTVHEHPAMARLRATMTDELHQVFGELEIAAHPFSKTASPQPLEAGISPRFDLGMLLEFAVVAAATLGLLVLLSVIALILGQAYL